MQRCAVCPSWVWIRDRLGKNADTHKGHTSPHEVGLPYELADRLTGDDEKAIREDAEKLTKLMGAGKAGAPAANPEPTQAKTGTAAAYQTLLNSMRTQEV